jgi:CheY-specific phosphatase CheX
VKTLLLLPVLGATRRVFDKMFASQTSVGSPAVARSWEESQPSLTAIIPVEGEQEGAFALSIPLDTLTAVAADMCAKPGSEITDQDRDGALRNVARMIASIARRDKRAGNLRMTHPFINTAGGAEDVLGTLRPWVAIPITTGFGRITLGASLHAPIVTQAPATPVAATVPA